MRWFRKLRFSSKRRQGGRGGYKLGERLEQRLALSGAPPAAANDSYAAPADAPLHISAPGVLANDSDPEDDALSAQIFSGASHGTVTLAADGSFTYLPEAGFTGIDTFVYRAFDGTGQSGLAAVTLHVGQSASPPPSIDLDGDDSAAPGFDFNSHFTEGGAPVAIADVDAEISAAGSALTSLQATITNRLDGASESLAADTTGTAIQAVYDASSARLTLSGVDSVAHYLQVLKTITYQNVSHQPNAQTRLISVTVDDGADESAEAIAHISVSATNDPPHASDDSRNANQNSPLTVAAPGVLGNDSDPEGDPLSAVVASGPQHGTLQLDADGSFVYTPAAGFSGTDQFTYQASDGQALSAAATVTIHVAADPPPPPTAANDVYQAASGVTLNVPAPGVLANDSGQGEESLSAELVTGPLHGTLTLHADGSFDYAPQAGFSGLDGFSYQVRQGSAASDVASVTINVASASGSDAPGASADSYLLGSTNSLVQSSDSVLSNDAAGGGTLTATVVVAPAHGTLVLNADGTFSYTANGSFHGIDHFSYKASNGNGDSTADVELVSQPAELIRKLYRDVLLRDPTLAEWEQGTDLLTSGQKTLDQIAATLLNSDEYLNLKIDQFYHDYLHRSAEQAGLNYWRDEVWRTSGGPDDVEAGILISREFWQASGANSNLWVTELYRRYLDREPDSIGYDYWTSLLADGSMNFRQVARGFVISPENDHNMAAAWYDLYLDRTVTPQEQSSLVAKLLAGDARREELAQEELVATVEYQSTPPRPNAGVAQRET